MAGSRVSRRLPSWGGSSSMMLIGRWRTSADGADRTVSALIIRKLTALVPLLAFVDVIIGCGSSGSTHPAAAGSSPASAAATQQPSQPTIPVPPAQVTTVSQVCQDFPVMAGIADRDMLENTGAAFMLGFVQDLAQWGNIANNAGVNKVGNLAGDLGDAQSDVGNYNLLSQSGPDISDAVRASQAFAAVESDCKALRN
jgi:hypothetical protein